MLEKLLSPFTSPGPLGVNIRYFLIAAGPLLIAFGFLTQEQFDAVQAYLGRPEVLGAISGLITGIVWIYGTITKSRSVKGDAAAKAIDADVPEASPVRIETPVGQEDIIITADGRKVG